MSRRRLWQVTGHADREFVHRHEKAEEVDVHRPDPGHERVRGGVQVGGRRVPAAGYPEVLECHHIAGEEDFLLKVAVRDIGEYEQFLLHKLSKIPGIDRVKTTFVLSTSKAHTAIPVE